MPGLGLPGADCRALFYERPIGDACKKALDMKHRKGTLGMKN